MYLLGPILSHITPDTPVLLHSPCPLWRCLCPLSPQLSLLGLLLFPHVSPAGLVLFPHSPCSPLRPQGLVRCLFGEELERVPAGDVACWIGGVVCKKGGRGIRTRSTENGRGLRGMGVASGESGWVTL